MLSTKLLSASLLKGRDSHFVLEIPPYRRPRLVQVLLRAFLQKTLAVLGRAVLVAAPAGGIIWILANVELGGTSLITALAGALQLPGSLMGMDGVMLLSFILGLPANEIVLPVAMMIYSGEAAMIAESSTRMGALLLQNGWTWVTGLCVMLFSLMHWPCSTSLLTIKKETGSWKWALLAAAIPTLAGAGSCMIVAMAARLLGL